MRMIYVIDLLCKCITLHHNHRASVSSNIMLLLLKSLFFLSSFLCTVEATSEAYKEAVKKRYGNEEGDLEGQIKWLGAISFKEFAPEPYQIIHRVGDTWGPHWSVSFNLRINNFDDGVMLNHMALSVGHEDYNEDNPLNKLSRVPEVQLDNSRIHVINSLIFDTFEKRTYRSNVLQKDFWYAVHVCQLPKKVLFQICFKK